MSQHKIYFMTFGNLYPLYLNKVEKKELRLNWLKARN